VINLTLDALAHFTQEDARLRGQLIPPLRHHHLGMRKSIAKRAARLLREPGEWVDSRPPRPD
jgi:hypothetical protein